MWAYEDPIPMSEAIRGFVAFYWNRVDGWYEEEQEIFVHPRDPYVRVDALPSSRRVRVEAGGETLAETARPVLVFETGHPVRYYIPPEDIRMDRLRPSPTRTRCPYKGEARYWSLEADGKTIEDVAWSYPAPVPECPGIKGLVCFYPERVDAIWVDGERA